MEYKMTKNKIYFENEAGEEIAYVLLKGEDVWCLESTFVRDDQRGKKLAEKIVAAAVEQARIQGKKIRPVCSYAVKQFEIKPEYEDVLEK